MEKLQDFEHRHSKTLTKIIIALFTGATILFALGYFKQKAYAMPSLVQEVTVTFSELGDVALTFTALFVCVLIAVIWLKRK